MAACSVEAEPQSVAALDEEVWQAPADGPESLANDQQIEYWHGSSSTGSMSGPPPGYDSSTGGSSTGETPPPGYESSSSSSTGTTTGGDGQWYAIPSGSIDDGFDCWITDNPGCSGKVDEQLSVCLDPLNLEYPDHDMCTEEPTTSQVNCQTWCQDQGHDDGGCITEETGADHCDCTPFRKDLGPENDDPGCVATYPVGDDQCAEIPRDYAAATCKRSGPEDDGEMDILVDKRTSIEGCAQSDIEDVDVDCDSWCDEHRSTGYGGWGFCNTKASQTCGGEEAAFCQCNTSPVYSTTVAALGAACFETFEDPDACPDEGEPKQKAQVCDGNSILIHPEADCAQGTLSVSTDCNEVCQDEGHAGGTCQDAAVEVTCPSGAEVQSAQCMCS